MKRYFLVLVLLFIGCAQKTYNIRWRGSVIDDKSTVPFTYWNDGIQLIQLQMDGVQLDLSGTQVGDYVYIYVSIYNKTNRIFTIYPSDSKLIQMKGKEKVEILPILPRNIRSVAASTSNLVTMLYVTSVIANNAIINKTNSVSEKAYRDFKNEQLVFKHELIQNDINRSSSGLIDLMLKNHSIQPMEHYYGYILFNKYNENLNLKKLFAIVFNVDGKKFSTAGVFKDFLKFDELDSKDTIKYLDFSR